MEVVSDDLCDALLEDNAAEGGALMKSLEMSGYLEILAGSQANMDLAKELFSEMGNTDPYQVLHGGTGRATR